MKVMEFFFSKEAGYNLTKKRLHQGSFTCHLLHFSKQLFTRTTFRETFCFFQAFMTFYQFFHHNYSISTITLRQLPWHSSIKIIIIWLTKQLKTPKKVKHFPENFHGGVLFSYILRVTLLKQVSNIDILLEKSPFFQKTLPAKHAELSCSGLETIVWYLIENVFCIVFLNLLLTKTWKNTCLEITPEKNA